MPKVFISYANEDRHFVEKEIISLLQRHGIQTWYSRDDVRSAEHWEETIRLGLESCDWFLVVLTERAVASDWVRAEVHWAMDERKGRFIPVLVEDCDWRKLHLKIRMIQLVDFRQIQDEERRKLLKCWDIKPVSLECNRATAQGDSRSPMTNEWPRRADGKLVEYLGGPVRENADYSVTARSTQPPFPNIGSALEALGITGREQWQRYPSAWADGGLYLRPHVADGTYYLVASRLRPY
jgi:TIR domain